MKLNNGRAEQIVGDDPWHLDVGSVGDEPGGELDEALSNQMRWRLGV